MKRLQFWHALIVLTMSLCPLPGTARAADRWYEVEVLVFSHLNADINAEKWPSNDSVSLALEGAVPAPNTITTPMMGAASAPSAQELLRLAAVPSAQYKLLDVFKTLSRSRNYRPLVHTAWRQPIGTGKSNFKIRIAGGKDYASRYGLHGKLLTSGDEPTSEGLWEVDGYVRLSASRFLHAETEMLFRLPSTVSAPIAAPVVPPPVVATPPATPEASSSTASTATPTTTAPVTDGSNLTWQTGDMALIDEDWLQFFKFSQSRRLKSNEVHYFDHPMFGMIIVLRPLEPERSGETDSE